MKKYQLLTLVFVLVAGLLAGSLLNRSILESAEAQSVSTPNRWEYCAITGITAAAQFTIVPSTLATANICYFESGCRKEVITANVESGDFEEARNVVLGRAVTRLGQNGWEMVGEATLSDRKVLYFRRHQK